MTRVISHVRWSCCRRYRIGRKDSVELACTLVDYAPENTFVVENIVENISISKPDLAPKVVARYLLARMRKLDESVLGSGDYADSDGVIEQDAESAHRASDRLRPYERLIDGASDWHRIENVARRSPNEFVYAMWPVVGRVVPPIGETGQSDCRLLQRSSGPFVFGERQASGNRCSLR